MELLVNTFFLGKPIWLWITFIGIILILIVFDLGVLQKKMHEISIRESLFLSGLYVSLGCIFGGWVWYYLGDIAGKEYFTGFLIEKTLSIDNIFVISLIFSFFQIPRIYQHRVLFWGILGVIILRAFMIGFGAVLIAHFYWAMYIFAVFLVWTGFKMLFLEEKKGNIEDNSILKLIQRYVRVTPNLYGEKFFIKLPDLENNKPVVWITPLMVALILIEFTDIIFALDSVPAIFAITQDPFIVYTSNIFAIMGLRAMYFALAATIHRFHYLQAALSLVLIFIGSKIFISEIFGTEKFPPSISLGVTLFLLIGGVFYSLIKSKNQIDKN